MLTALPPELMRIVCQNLEKSDLAKLARVSQHVNAVVQDHGWQAVHYGVDLVAHRPTDGCTNWRTLTQERSSFEKALGCGHDSGRRALERGDHAAAIAVAQPLPDPPGDCYAHCAILSEALTAQGRPEAAAPFIAAQRCIASLRTAIEACDTQRVVEALLGGAHLGAEEFCRLQRDIALQPVFVAAVKVLQQQGLLARYMGQVSMASYALMHEALGIDDWADLWAGDRICRPSEFFSRGQVVGLDGIASKINRLMESPSCATRSLLLWGEPSNGKTELVLGAAQRFGTPCYWLGGNDFLPHLAEPERLIQALFRLARRERSIIYLDDAAWVFRRNPSRPRPLQPRIIEQFNIEMRSTEPSHGIVILGTTNEPWNVHPDGLQCFQERHRVALPDEAARRQILKQKLASHHHDLREADFTQLAKMTELYSGGNLKMLVREAAYIPVRAVSKARYFAFNADGELEPCEASTPGSITRAQAEQQPMRVSRRVTMQHLLDAATRLSPTMDAARVRLYDQGFDAPQRNFRA